MIRMRSPLSSRRLRTVRGFQCVAVLWAVASLGFARPLDGAVARLVIKERVLLGSPPFGTSGQYEKLTGRLELEVDPDAAANAAVIDLTLAPRNAQGRGAFSTPFFFLQPVAIGHGNHSP